MRKALVVLVVLLSLHEAFSQEQSKRALVTYDPLFWKEKLNLNAGQSRRIRDINSAFYTKLMAVYNRDHENRTLLRSAADEQLTVRSEEIWKTLYPRQRRKWEKILSQNQVN